MATNGEGVAQMEQEVEVLACPEILLSAACLAAVVIGAQAPETDSLLLGVITFPAVCQDSTVLRRGFAVNFVQHKAPHPRLSIALSWRSRMSQSSMWSCAKNTSSTGAPHVRTTSSTPTMSLTLAERRCPRNKPPPDTQDPGAAA